MKRYLRIATILTFGILASISPLAQAGVISRDWKTPGDGLLTYDDASRREWLDLTETLLINFPGAVPSSISQRYQNVLTQTAVGGLFEGFVAASQSDVVALAQSAGVDTSTESIAINLFATNRLIDLLNPTREQSEGRRLDLGYVSDFPVTALLAVTPQADMAGLYLGPISTDPAGIPAVAGVWLFRPVPEPSSLLLSVAFMATLPRAIR